MLSNPRSLTRAVVAKVVEQPPEDEFGLATICQAEIERLKLDTNPRFSGNPDEFAKTLIAKGVLAYDENDRLYVPIPSMATWLGARPVAVVSLPPSNEPTRSFIGSMRGTVIKYEDPFEPAAPARGWSALK